jgi:hypothetical protein
MISTTTNNDITTRRTTIMKRWSCKNCGVEIYLQHKRFASKLKWISFDLDGKLHLCAAKPLKPKTKQLIQKIIDRMEPTSTANSIYTNINNIKVLHRIVLFSDRPNRIVETVSTSDFVGNWTAGSGSFAADAPNDALLVENTQTGNLETAII